MSPYRTELNRRIQAWRTSNKKRGCPKDVRLAIAKKLREEVGPPVTGLASLSPERRAEISAMGGKAAHERGTAYSFTAEKAREAGKLGGTAAHAAGRAHRFTSEEASTAGKKGAIAKSAG